MCLHSVNVFHINSALKVVEEYNKREQEIKHLEKELEDKSHALDAYRQNISEVHDVALQ